MFSYVYMKLLERRPATYDARMSRASRGRIHAVKAAVVDRAVAALGGLGTLLEIGCGTGELAAALVQAGFRVHGVDANPAMIAVAQDRIARQGLAESLEVETRGVETLDGFADHAFDGVVSTLVLSELGEGERHYALKHARRVVRDGGVLILADEVLPRTRLQRARHALGRAPALALTYLVTGSASRPVHDLAAAVHEAGLTVLEEERSHGDAFSLVVARKEASC